jgi:hypothetical protein
MQERRNKVMKQAMIAFATSLLGLTRREAGVKRGRSVTNDISFLYRMGAGSPGDITRYEHAKIEPVAIDGANPVLSFGLAGVYDRTATNGVRSVTGTDTAIDGFVVRPYPTQVSSGTNYGAAPFGVGAAPATGIADLLKSGYMLAKLGGTQAAVKGGVVNIWIAASSGTHVQGGVEAAATGGSTIALSANGYFNGPADAGGIVEIAYNI